MRRFIRQPKYQRRVLAISAALVLVYLTSVLATRNLLLWHRVLGFKDSNNVEMEVPVPVVTATVPQGVGATEGLQHPRETITEYVDYVKDYAPEDLRTRLANKYPYDRTSKIPRKIWQIWQTREVADDKLRKFSNSWCSQLGFDYNMITDDDVQEFLLENYGEFPEILETFKILPANILRFDLLRYLVLYSEGGLYTDIDTLNIVEVDKWIDVSNDELQSQLWNSITNVTTNDIGFMVGIEGDYDQLDWKLKTCRRLQFCQWTMKSKRGHPILRELIHAIVRITLQDFSQRLNHVKIRGTYHTLHSIYTILEWTGPGIVTDTIFNHMNRITPEFLINNNPTPTIKHTIFDHSNKDPNTRTSDSKSIGWEDFTKITQPVLFDDVLIMPINTFNGFITDIEYPVDPGFTYIKHDFRGTWKSLS